MVVKGHVVLHSNARGGYVAIPVGFETDPIYKIPTWNVTSDDRLVHVDAEALELPSGTKLLPKTFHLPRHKCGQSWFLTPDTDEQQALESFFRDDALSVCERVRAGECPITAAQAARRSWVSPN